MKRRKADSSEVSKIGSYTDKELPLELLFRALFRSVEHVVHINDGKLLCQTESKLFTSTKATRPHRRSLLVHINGGKLFTSTGCERVGGATKHVSPNAYLFNEKVRTPRIHQAFEIKGSSGLPKRFDVLTT